MDDIVEKLDLCIDTRLLELAAAEIKTLRAHKVSLNETVERTAASRDRLMADLGAERARFQERDAALAKAEAELQRLRADVAGPCAQDPLGQMTWQSKYFRLSRQVAAGMAETDMAQNLKSARELNDKLRETNDNLCEDNDRLREELERQREELESVRKGFRLLRETSIEADRKAACEIGMLHEQLRHEVASLDAEARTAVDEARAEAAKARADAALTTELAAAQVQALVLKVAELTGRAQVLEEKLRLASELAAVKFHAETRSAS